MQSLIYDGSFAGWLSAVFDVYEYKFDNVDIVPAHQRQDSLFGHFHTVVTEDTKATRVWKGLQQRLSATACKQVYKTFLSEEKGMETTLLHYARYAFGHKTSVEQDYSHPAVLYVVNTARRVHREKHRMEAFVRFQQTKDNLYYAVIQPDFNVLPLIKDHFEKRYADQLWMIYDSTRRYGIYYDLQATTTVQVDFSEAADNNDARLYDEKEPLYQSLWQQYFQSVNIAARKNTRLHIRHMPLRYWKHLTEKQPRHKA